MRLYYRLLVACILLMVVGASVAAVSYQMLVRQSEARWISRLAHRLPFPAARVGSRWVSYAQYLDHVDAERRFLKSQAGQAPNVPRLTEAQIKVNAFEQVIRSAAVEEFADQEHIVLTPLDIDRVYGTFRQQTGTSTTPAEFRDILQKQFGWSEEEFKRFNVRPILLEDELAKKMPGDKDRPSFAIQLTDRLLRSDVVRYLRISDP